MLFRKVILNGSRVRWCRVEIPAPVPSCQKFWEKSNITSLNSFLQKEKERNIERLFNFQYLDNYKEKIETLISSDVSK